MLNAYQIIGMNEAEKDAFLKSLLVSYVQKEQGMYSLDLLNALLNFALAEGIIADPDEDQKNLILNHVRTALTKGFDFGG